MGSINGVSRKNTHEHPSGPHAGSVSDHGEIENFTDSTRLSSWSFGEFLLFGLVCMGCACWCLSRVSEGDAQRGCLAMD